MLKIILLRKYLLPLKHRSTELHMNYFKTLTVFLQQINCYELFSGNT